MKYIGPRDNPATEGTPYPPYVNGDRQAGIKGSIPDGRVFEHLQREIEYVITQAGLTPDEATLTQLHQAITAIAGGGGGGGLVSVVHDETLTGTGVDEATKLSVIQATETQRGAVELATADEARALADAVRAITPATLLAVLTYLRLNSGLPANAAGFLSNNGAGVLSWIGAGIVSDVKLGAAGGTGANVTFTMSNSNLANPKAYFRCSAAPIAKPTINGVTIPASIWSVNGWQSHFIIMAAGGKVWIASALGHQGGTFDPYTSNWNPVYGSFAVNAGLWHDMGAYNGSTIAFTNGGDTSNNMAASNYLIAL